MNLQTTILIPPAHLSNVEQFLLRELRKCESMIFNGVYINKITEIVSFKYLKYYDNGSCIFSVNYTADVLNPQVGDIITCILVKNRNIVYGKADPYICIIINDVSHHNTNDSIKVEIKQIELKIKCKHINIIGEAI